MTTTTTTTRRLSPRQRAQRLRWAQYALLVVAAALAIWLADWPAIYKAFLRPDLILAAVTGGLFSALWMTISYTAGAFVLGLVAGTVVALMRLSPVGPYRWIASAYIEFFRGLPAILVFIAFSLIAIPFPGLQMPWEPYGTVWLALGLVATAYMAETIRAGIQAVPKGQVEAARSLGMPAMVASRKIVLPQAFRIVLPPLTNELILLVKDSSLVFVVGVSLTHFDLTKWGRAMANSEANLTPLVVAGFAYLLITLPLSTLVRRMEHSAEKAH
ncbi:MAG: ABC transporter permease subunit [Micromonosporaceae bacterium]|nr:ABC transporter permease subunit [Micromonosporaceae bacterium]